ncbi:hypothetical protein [Mesorhizobium sp.]|uniref:hypothetical protein n=1 Tax=Mesorhizobium sp. TaxID=1871066 RepID=UPI000FE8A904|nr:hypothetical protein [Mesorhizobium sp.]RWI07337.1 MAG: hypothetical protein EOQ90_23915 [Mesorhizobium sp.]RWK48665.1 MAG: hypothetical protein EOR48_30300 [Mesorhizobium sp.]RWK93428.1 MAG: hypothetical protein EOR53_22945 [Mesorhizobium sp.]RWL17215.1 MAG: hypothetical protein EOR57_25810 [Mesorhizobium sp.]TIP40169.1 MAG: hypothetical protein E5X62_29220 [Mesorhizobium sp.]
MSKLSDADVRFAEGVWKPVINIGWPKWRRIFHDLQWLHGNGADSLRQLEILLSGIPPRMRSYCHEVGKVGGGSYSKSCIQMESDAASSTPEFKYR